MSSTQKYAELQQQMLWEIAAGMEEPEDIARRYGFTAVEWSGLSARPEVIRLVDQYKAELAASGQTFKNKAKLYADTLMDRTFKMAIHPDCQLKDRVVALQLLAKLADLEPKNQVQAQGNGFSITITLPSAPIQQEESKDVIEAEEVKELGEPLSLSFGGEENTQRAECPDGRDASDGGEHLEVDGSAD